MYEKVVTSDVNLNLPGSIYQTLVALNTKLTIASLYQ